MAANRDSPLEKIAQQVMCPICMEIYRHPKALACLHTYCKECIQSLVHRRRKDEEITCPQCRTDVPVAGNNVNSLPTVFFINELIDIYKAMKQASDNVEVACQSCSDGKAVAFCRTCDEKGLFICATCEGAHKQMKVFADHKVVSLTELKRGSLIHLPSKMTPPTYTCSKHNGELKKLYCFTCSQLICRDCTLVDHPKDSGHKFDFVNSVASAFKSELATKLLPIQDAHTVAAQAVSQLEESRKAITEQGEKSKQEIARAFNELQALLEKHKKVLLTQVGEATERKKTTVEKKQNKFKIAKNECEGVIEFARLTSDSACDEDLVSMKADIEKRLREVVIKTEHFPKSIPAETANDNNNTMIIALPSKDEFEKFINKQGFVAFLEGSSAKATTGKRSVFMFRLTNTQGQPSLGSLKITAEVQSLTDNKAIVPASIRNKIPSVFEASYTPSVRGHHQLIVKINTNETATFPIFVSHPVTSLGTPVRVIKSEATNRAWRIALSDNGDIYFTQQRIECYVHLDHNGSVKRIVKCIKNKFARGIEVESKTGNVFISGSHKLQKYNSCGELVKEIGDVTPGAQPGELHEPNDVRLHKNRIYICDSGNGRVQIFDPDLNYVYSFGTKGRETGQLHWPEDIDFDTDGNAYIVDSRRNCILLFSPTYQFIREINSLQTPPLRFLIALRIHGDYIYISDAYQGVLACDKSTGKIIHHFSDSPVDVKGHSQVFPVGIAIDADGYMYVCQRAKHCLSIY